MTTQGLFSFHTKDAKNEQELELQRFNSLPSPVKDKLIDVYAMLNGSQDISPKNILKTRLTLKLYDQLVINGVI